ncbi:MAG: STAS domain-containing protein [Actinomycetota bacterium]
MGNGTAVPAEVDVATWATLSSVLRRIVDAVEDGQEGVLDLTGLSFIDGHGVRLIAEAARQLGPSKRLVIRGAPKSLLRIGEILGLDREPGLRIEGADGIR